jgi:hypothetical protein
MLLPSFLPFLAVLASLSHEHNPLLTSFTKMLINPRKANNASRYSAFIQV